MCGKLRGMPQENGKLSLSTLTRLSVGGYLTTAAANSFERLRLAGARDGVNVTITSTADAYREYAIQERIFTERYLPTYTQYAPGKVDRRLWQGRYWFRRAGTAAAAAPGTSNHGWAIAIDIANVGGFNSTFYRWLSNNAPALGWSNDEGHSVGEAWHWTYKSGSDGGGGTAPDAPTPVPTPTPVYDFLEDIMSATPIRFFSWKDTAGVTHIFEADLLSGTYWKVRNMETLRDRKSVLDGAEIPWQNHPGGSGDVPGYVANGAAFGTQVGS